MPWPGLYVYINITKKRKKKEKKIWWRLTENTYIDTEHHSVLGRFFEGEEKDVTTDKESFLKKLVCKVEEGHKG